jgi:hypothetical protein
LVNFDFGTSGRKLVSVPAKDIDQSMQIKSYHYHLTTYVFSLLFD